MFEKLINDFKESLPESLRNKLGGSRDAGDVTQEYETNIKSNEDAEEEKKKNRNSMIIRVVIILGIAAFVVDEYFLEPTPPEPPALTAEQEIAKARAKRKKNLPVAEPAVTAEEAPALETQNAEATSIPTETQPEGALTQIPQEEVAVAPPVENITIMPKTEEVPPTPALEEVTTSIPTPPPSLPAIEEKVDQLASNIEPETSPPEEIKIPSQDPMQAPAQEPSTPSLDSGMSSMASKIVEEEVATAPPAYDQVGRGLVYNCKDRHWACLDKAAYVVCNKNMKWNKSKGSPAECVVQDIYSSDEDCAKIQKYNVSTSLATPFCQN